MDSAALTLAAGPHSLVVTAEESWEVVEYLEVTTLISATTAPTSAAAAVFGTNADIGSVATAGTSSFANGIYTLTDSGGDIWNPAVAFQYDYQTMIGDGSITVRVSSLTNTDPWAKAGVMMRQSLDPEDLFTAVYATPGNGVVFQGLPSAGASDFSSGVGATAPCWVRLTRSGNSFSSSTSTDGIAWTPIQTITIAMSAQVYVGLAVCSHNLSEVATATFDSLTLAAANSTGTSATTSTATTTATTSTPTPTTGASATAAPTTTTSTPTGNPSSTPTAAAVLGSNADIGSVATAGTSAQANGVYTLTDSGADIWDATVAFQYDYQAMTGDGSITVRVASLQNTDSWAKAGIMIRQSLDPLDVFAAVYETPGNGVAFQGCPTIGASDFSSSGAGTAPAWVRLTRAGNLFNAYSSTDGTDWTLIGAAPIAMSTSVYVGLVVSSHNPYAVATATFDSLSVTPGL
jgi:regulation of enolase protein 1 (concanavalin A-like superfamily)